MQLYGDEFCFFLVLSIHQALIYDEIISWSIHVVQCSGSLHMQQQNMTVPDKLEIIINACSLQHLVLAGCFKHMQYFNLNIATHSRWIYVASCSGGA